MQTLEVTGNLPFVCDLIVDSVNPDDEVTSADFRDPLCDMAVMDKSLRNDHD